MREFFVRFRSYFIYAAFFSLVINLLMLVPALFMLQVFDRVVSSRSQETLVMLAVLAAGALLFMAYLDVIRSRLLSGAGVALEKLVGPRVLVEMVRRGAMPGGRNSMHGLRDEETALPLVQQFLSNQHPDETVAPPPAARPVAAHIEQGVRGLQ